MGIREDHKGVLIIESGKWAKAKAYPAAGELALGSKSINNWGCSGTEMERCAY